MSGGLARLLGLALLGPALPVMAQPATKVARVGFLSAETRSAEEKRVEQVRAGLRELGYVEGRNLAVETRWAEGRYDRLPDLAAELVRLKVDVVVAFGTKAVLGAKRATTTVPIVMASSGDVLALGVISSLARPGGNITGSINVGRELGPKRLELLKEVMPRLAHVGYLVNPANPALAPNLQAMRATARTLKVQLQPFEVRGPTEYAGAFEQMTKARVEAVVLQDETSFAANREMIVDLLGRHRFPSAGNRSLAEAGVLIGYGPDPRALESRAAVFVDKILKGAKPGDLPVEQPTKFDMLVNLKTAQALGLPVPSAVTARADQLIR